jgi:hypothetical protein
MAAEFIEPTILEIALRHGFNFKLKNSFERP